MPDKISLNGSGNLRDDYETSKLKEFRRSIQDIVEPQHDDTFIKRYLKARDFDVIKAEKMIRESFKFRRNFGVEYILNGKYDYPTVYKKFPIFHRIGFAKDDHSVVQLIALGPCDIKGFVNSLTVKELKKVFIYLFEGNLKEMRVHKKEMNVPILDDQITYVIDYRNLSMRQFDKQTIKVIIEIIIWYQNNYPETLKRTYFVNVPSFFQWVFSIFKPFMNEVILSKIKIIDNWQDELRRIIDPKDLPAFLGGEFMDPEGDVDCSNLICWDARIPQHYFLSNRIEHKSMELQNFLQATIARRDVLQVPAEVVVPGSVLSWAFRTKLYNIKFGLFYKNQANEMEEVLSVEEVESHVVTEENEIICQKNGTYVLHFDNSYSWLTAKHLYYKVEIISPDNIENDK